MNKLHGEIWMKRYLSLFVISSGLLMSILPVFAQTPATLTLWRHETGDDEVNANLEAIERFNTSQDEYEIVWETLPQGTYTESITAASLAGDLPCIFDMDQPTVPNFAWAGHIVPLDDLLDPAILADLNEGGKGTYNGKIYSVGQFDVALGIFARKSVLEANDIRIPTVEEPWTRDEFDAILVKLDTLPELDYAFDVNAAWTGEWASYAYSPMLQSFGGDLINRENYTEADGTLNGKEAVAWGQWFQSLFTRGLADSNPPDADGFKQGRVGLHYTGSWSVGDYTEAIGDDLLFLPVPDYGAGPKIGAASWQWGISTSCEYPEGAAAFINFIMSPEEVAAISNATSLIPTTSGGAALTENYAEGGKWRSLYDFSANFAVVRPPTPAYPFISSAFERAVIAIRDGADVQDSLDDAVDAIEQNIADNKGYGLGG
jgi:multiple sugar transport system substrate-binding protein